MYRYRWITNRDLPRLSRPCDIRRQILGRGLAAKGSRMLVARDFDTHVVRLVPHTSSHLLRSSRDSSSLRRSPFRSVVVAHLGVAI